MSEENNNIIKKDSAILQRTDTQIAITDKLVAKSIERLVEEYNNKAQKLRLEEKDYEGAIEFYTKAIELNPNFILAYFRRGLCKGALKNHVGQIEDYSRVIELDPTSDHFISRAIVRFKVEDYEGIINDCTQAIALNDKDSSAYQYRGKAKAKLRSFKEAIEDFDKAIEIHENIKKDKPNSFFKLSYEITLRERGLSKISIGDYKGSLEDFDKVVDIDPKHPVAYKYRAEAKSKLGDLVSARIDLEEFQKKDEEWQKKYGASFDKE